MLIFRCVFLGSDYDLSDEKRSESSDEDDDKPLYERDDEKMFEGTWPWKTGQEPPPFFSVDNPREGTPNQVPWNVEDWRPIDFFFRMIPAKFFDILVDQSNLYASQKMSGVRGHSNRFGPEITRNEVFSFIAILFAMGVCRCRNLQMYWDDKSPSVISLPAVSHVLDRTRFDTIKKFFHMADNSKAAPKGSPSHDILHKVRPLLSELQSNCRKFWKVGTFASLDESMINFRGRSRFNPPNKNVTL